MKNLFFALSLGTMMVFSGAAFGQEVKDGEKPKQEQNNTRSNGKNNMNRKFGQERAANMKQMNGEKQERTAAFDNKQEGKDPQKEAEKKARKEEKDRLKAEKKMVKKNKTRK
ncbi:MAG: hypothetical protein EOP53_06315 [Sphingobacteriales bacterium]|nr:MAG: hypothetical protein EOP53_06315 [Sphingobacteriales bacterium]